jgi:bifunctional DNA-binding transcriptional regulator/antitoxin component of YhaV-PrlF toxin-antitoxin module
MEYVKLDKQGQVSLPASILHRLGLADEAVLTAEVTEDGGVLLRPSEHYDVEIYTDERLAEFEEENRLTEEEARLVDRALGRK